jgi:phosphomevalonate kinase
MISFQAPGKAVIWGEYAVLAGAPAMVMAVNRFAECRIEPGGETWHCQSRGFDAELSVSAEDLLRGEVSMQTAAAPLAAAVRTLGVSHLPAGARVLMDSRPFYGTGEPARKLGIGSSAAICTAACAALAELDGKTLTFELALKAHRLMQQAEGSGIDVAAAFHGGVLKFVDGSPSPAVWPENLHFQFIWTGVSAKTTSHLRTFSDWRETGDSQVLDRLSAACTELFSNADLDRLSQYVELLKILDTTANLGIYTQPHQVLDRLAIEQQLVYKPCGAGGGDIGIVFADHKNDADARDALETYAKTARDLAFHPLSLEIAAHGLKPTR